MKPVDALSEAKREGVNQWYSNTLLSRLDNKETGIILVVMQRVHQDDLSGYLLRDSEDGYDHLELPAIAEIPQAHPARPRAILRLAGRRSPPPDLRKPGNSPAAAA